MKMIAVNGSPRKTWNTATLLEEVVAGAGSAGADAELVHLYDLTYRGCVSCFACKRLGSPGYGSCVHQDGLTPLLQRLAAADAFVLGSPIYFSSVSGEMRSFLERLLFPYLTYTDPPGTLFARRIRTAFLFTMNVPEDLAGQFGYLQHFAFLESLLKRIFGESESLACFDTLQFDDYSKVLATRFDPAKKARRRAEDFPGDRRRAFELGARLVRAAS